MEKEIWKEIEGTNGLYKISNLGKVWYAIKNLILKPSLRGGYLFVRFPVNGKPKNYLIHRLIAEYFIPNPQGKPEINHKDSIKTNNNISNLEWVTHRENRAHYCLTKKKSSKFTGVTWRPKRNKWEAAIQINKKIVSWGAIILKQKQPKPIKIGWHNCNIYYL